MGVNSILLKKDTIFAHGKCPKNFNDTIRFFVEHYPNVGFTKFKVHRERESSIYLKTQEAYVN
jgi:hypothetical protein